MDGKGGPKVRDQTNSFHLNGNQYRMRAQPTKMSALSETKQMNKFGQRKRGRNVKCFSWGQALLLIQLIADTGFHLLSFNQIARSVTRNWFWVHSQFSMDESTYG